MDFSNTTGYSLPSTTGYVYEDDGLGGLVDDGLGSSYDMPQPDEPPALDYFDGFTEPAPAEKPQEDSSAPAPSSSAPGHSAGQAADDADDGGLDAELEAELDKQLFAVDQPASASKGAADASKSPAGDDDSDVETIDEAADSDGEDARSREDSQQPEDPAQAEQQRQSAWYKECYDAMTEAQRNRLEAYNRSNLQRKTMKKVLQELTGSGSANDKLLIALSAVTKMFVGELVATARQAAACQGHTGALLPSHIRAAYQVLSEDGKVPHKTPSKPLRLR